MTTTNCVKISQRPKKKKSALVLMKDHSLLNIKKREDLQGCAVDKEYAA